MTDINLKDGGKVAVFVGTTGNVREFLNDPRVDFFDCLQIDSRIIGNSVSQNTKAIVVAPGIPQDHYAFVLDYCRRRKIPYLARNSNQAIYELLKKWVGTAEEEKVTVEEIKEEITRGKLKTLIPHIDFSKSNVENAKLLEKLAREQNIKTTFNSLTQFVSKQRRLKQGTTVPKSARNKLDLSVDMFDSMIKDLQGMRDFIIEISEENRTLKGKLEKFKKAMED